MARRRGSGCVISRGGMKGRSKWWVLNRVGGGLRVLVGLRVWKEGVWGDRGLKWERVMVCAEHSVWLVFQDVEAKTMRLEEHGKVVLVLERTSQGASSSCPPTPGRNR